MLIIQLLENNSSYAIQQETKFLEKTVMKKLLDEKPEVHGVDFRFAVVVQ